MTDQNSIKNTQIANNWGLPIFVATLAFTFEISLQRRLGNEVKSNIHTRAVGAAVVGFIFTKYFFTNVDSHIQKNNAKKEEERLKKMQQEGISV